MHISNLQLDNENNNRAIKTDKTSNLANSFSSNVLSLSDEPQYNNLFDSNNMISNTALSSKNSSFNDNNYDKKINNIDNNQQTLSNNEKQNMRKSINKITLYGVIIEIIGLLLCIIGAYLKSDYVPIIGLIIIGCGFIYFVFSVINNFPKTIRR